MSVTLETLEPVRASALLSDFKDEELGRLAASMDLVEFDKDQHLFEQDEAGDALYIILSGQVGVIRKILKEQRQKERMLAVVGLGECIGEMALADEGPRSATIVALEPVRAVKLTRDRYEALRDADPKLAIKMALSLFRLLSKRLRQINKNLEIVQYWMFA
ncbi:MAG: cyclic nucleotide-binding domain-containing protein [bacterium]